MTPPAPIVVRIPVARPFHGAALLRFLADRAVPGVEVAGERHYARTLALPGGPATIRLDFPTTHEAPASGGPTAGSPAASGGAAGDSPSPIEVTATLFLADPADADAALARCRHLLGADAPAATIHETLIADPVLAEAVTLAPGIRVPGAMDGPEILVRALVGQQISVAAARTALHKLTVSANLTVASPVDGLTHLFPSPAAIAEIGAAGIAGPRRRAAAIASAAHDMAGGALVIDGGRDYGDLSAELVARAGIGPWTADYVAMRVLAEPDVLLTGDLALRNGAAALGIDPADLAQVGARWSPYRSFAGMYLWRSCPPRTVPSRALRRQVGMSPDSAP